MNHPDDPAAGVRFPDAPPPLASPRLELRALVDADAPTLFEFLADPVAMRYWSTPPLTRIEQAAALIERARAGAAEGQAIRWGLYRREGGRLVGTCTLFGLDAQNRRAEIGYMLGRPWWGQGLMREALAVVLAYAFGPLGLHRVEADVDPRNEASLRLLEHLGFTREGLLRERWRVGNEIADSLILGLLAPDWEKRDVGA